MPALTSEQADRVVEALYNGDDEPELAEVLVKYEEVVAGLWTVLRWANLSRREIHRVSERSLSESIQTLDRAYSRRVQREEREREERAARVEARLAAREARRGKAGK